MRRVILLGAVLVALTAQCAKQPSLYHELPEPPYVVVERKDAGR